MCDSLSHKVDPNSLFKHQVIRKSAEDANFDAVYEYLDKELCRQKKLRHQENITVQNYSYDIKEKKWKLQLNQLENPLSDTFRYFLQCLAGLAPEERKHFLQCLKLGLNERSVKILQPLYEEYEKCRSQDDSEEKDRRLLELDEQLTNGSLGIEHFYREMADTIRRCI